MFPLSTKRKSPFVKLRCLSKKKKKECKGHIYSVVLETSKAGHLHVLEWESLKSKQIYFCGKQIIPSFRLIKSFFKLENKFSRS